MITTINLLIVGVGLFSYFAFTSPEPCPRKYRVTLEQGGALVYMVAIHRYCEYYLKSGDWIGIFSGANEEHKVVPRVIAMAYNSDGTPKRTVGFWYPDIETVWTKKMDDAPIKAVKKLQAITDKQFTADL